MSIDTRTRRDRERTREETWNALQRDAADAATHGWTLTAQGIRTQACKSLYAARVHA